MRKSSILLSLVSLALLAGPSKAADKPQLTVYTYDSFSAEWGPGPKVEAAFEAVCDCDLVWQPVADGAALLNRVRLEGKDTKADVVLGLDTNLVEDARATGLFAAHGLDTSALQVPGGYTDDTFLPFDYGHFAVIYDSETVKNPPSSLKDLVEGNPDEKIVLQDPRTSTPGLGFLFWMKAVYGDEAGKAWEQLSKRVLAVTPGWSEAYGMFTNGEAQMVLSYVTSPAYHMVVEGSDRYKAAAFSEGHYLQIEVSALVASSSNKGLARDFLAFTMTPAFQDLIPTNNWMMPAAGTANPLPDAFGKLVTPEKTLLFSPAEAREMRRAAIDEWLQAMSR